MSNRGIKLDNSKEESRMTTKYLIGCIVCIMLVVGGGIALASRHAKSSSACVAKADEQCPPDDDYTALSEFQARWKAPQDQLDLMNGKVTRLMQTTPQGYHFDLSRVKYVKNAPPPTPSAPPSTPTPIPLPTEPTRR